MADGSDADECVSEQREQYDGDGPSRYRKRLHCDVVDVEVQGDDPEWVAREFDAAVAQAFVRYDEHVAGNGGYNG